MPVRKGATEFKYTKEFLDALFGEDLHAKRVLSLTNATVGVMTSASLAVSTIGHGLALARGGLSKHAIKQLDRLLSNPGIDVKELSMLWVPAMIGSRKSVEIAMDWTDFDADNQTTIMLSLLTSHGRATPLVWLTVDKDTLKDNRNHYEYQVLVWLAEALPADIKVLIVADRGFGDHKLYRVLTEELKFDYVIRFRGNIKVTAADGETRAAIDWVGKGGRMRILRGAAVTAEDYPVGAVVCVQAKDMKEPWCLATSLAEAKARILLKKYAKRWGIECSFRDTKDPHFGLGMGQIRVSSPERRDRLWLLNALAVALLTLLGAAGEALGFDKHLKASTTKRRVHSLFRQGCLHYQLMPTMQEARLRPLMEKFAQLMLEQPLFANIYGLI
jgi:Transposase DDE domain